MIMASVMKELNPNQKYYHALKLNYSITLFYMKITFK